jgi:hypothetical protein
MPFVQKPLPWMYSQQSASALHGKPLMMQQAPPKQSTGAPSQQYISSSEQD